MNVADFKHISYLALKKKKKKKPPEPYLNTFHRDQIAPLLNVRPVTFKSRSCHYAFCLPCSRVDISTIIYVFFFFFCKIKSSHMNPTLSHALTIKHSILAIFFLKGRCIPFLCTLLMTCPTKLLRGHPQNENSTKTVM